MAYSMYATAAAATFGVVVPQQCSALLTTPTVLTFGGFTVPTDAYMTLVSDALGGGNGTGYYEGMPVAWTGSFRHRNGTFYTNLGHGVKDWERPVFSDHVIEGMPWAADGPVPEECG